MQYLTNTELALDEDGATMFYRKLTVAQALEAAEEIESSGGISESSIKGGYDFTKTRSLREAINLGRFGWEEGTRQILDPGSVDIDDLTTISVIVHDVEGLECDIAAYNQGLPENMLYIDNMMPSPKLVRVLINLTQHAYVDSGDMLRKASNIFQSFEALRLMGYVLSISGLDYGSPSGYGHKQKRMLYEIPILEEGGMAVPSKLAFTLGHPSFLRRIIFAVNESEPDHVSNAFGYHSGGGYSEPRSSIDTAAINIINPEGDDVVIVDKDDGFERDPKDFLCWLKNRIDSQRE